MTRKDSKKVQGLEALFRAVGEIDSATWSSSEQVSRKQARLQPRKILVATDGSPASADAIKWASDLAKRFRAKITVVTVIGPRARYQYYGAAAAGLWADEEREGVRILTTAKKRLARARVRCRTRLLAGSPTREIVREAASDGSDLIILGSHGRGAAGRLLLGSVADGVKNQARTSVLIARSSPPARRVLIAYDGSPLSRRAADFGLWLAKRSAGNARLLHVIPPPYLGPVRQAGAAFQQVLADALRKAGGRPPVPIDVRFGAEADHILRSAKANRASLIVMGSRGMGWMERWVVGSVSTAVAHKAHTAVLLIKEARK